MVRKGEKDQTFQGFTNISSSKGSTILFDLSKSFIQLFLEMYGERKNKSFSIRTLIWFENQLKIFPFFVMENQTQISNKINRSKDA